MNLTALLDGSRRNNFNYTMSDRSYDEAWDLLAVMQSQNLFIERTQSAMIYFNALEKGANGFMGICKAVHGTYERESACASLRLYPTMGLIV